MTAVRLRAAAAALAVTAAASPLAAAPPASTPARKPPARAPAASFDELARKGEEAKNAGRYDEAIEIYRQALTLKPDWLEGRFVLGMMLYDSDRHAESRDEFRRLLQQQPKNGMVMALKGMSEFRLKNYERALQELRDARELGIPNQDVFWVASYTAAILLNRIEEYEAAFEILREFARNDRDTVPVIEAFGLSLLRMPFLPNEAPPDRREMILMAGRAGYHQAKGRTTTFGRQAFEELVSRYPNAPNVHYAYGVHLLSDAPDQALEEFKRELRSSPTHTHAMLQIAYELIKQGKPEEAKPYAEQATQLAPNLFAAHNALGRALLDTGDVDRAIQHLEAGMKLAPESPEVRFSLARAYARAGRADDAARERAEFLRLDKQRRAAKPSPPPIGGVQTEAEPANPPSPPN
jgi:tetratricopeptide (TPR) repeat protein